MKNVTFESLLTKNNNTCYIRVFEERIEFPEYEYYQYNYDMFVTVADENGVIKQETSHTWFDEDEAIDECAYFIATFDTYGYIPELEWQN